MYGRRLVPSTIDEIARTEPLREAFQIPRSDQPSDGWSIVTFKDYCNAVNLCAHTIVNSCGTAPARSFPTLAYIGPQDARYVIFMVAAVKAGYQALFISPRNSLEGQLSLFNQTSCDIIFCTESYLPAVKTWSLQREMRIIQVEDIDKWLPRDKVPHFPYKKTFEDAEFEPLCVLHTSGSTGLPKAITARHGMLAIGDAVHNLGEWQGSTHWVRAWAETSKRHFVPMPLFHAAALYVFVLNVIWWKVPVVLGLGDRPLTSDLTMECLEHLEVESAVLPPSILEDMSQDAGCVEALRKLHLPKPELWQYFIINSDLFGCEWRKIDENDTVCELVVVRKDKHPGMQGFFYTFPELEEFSTNDLYKPHPELPNHWMYYGRADNIIVFSNGEKLNPATIEGIVQSHPQVKGALVVGSNRFQPGLLIEPSATPHSKEEETAILDSLWPYVEKANSETSSHAQISRDFIALSPPERPFLRTGKGTVQRAATLASLAKEIEMLYQEAQNQLSSSTMMFNLSPDSLPESLVEFMVPYVRIPGLTADTNFFSLGMDSLQVVNLSRKLRASLEAAGGGSQSTLLSPRAIYNNPTPRRLSRFLLSLIDTQVQGVQPADVDFMRTFYTKYTSDLIAAKDVRPEASRDEMTVLLTGSTGALGSYVLDRLFHSPRVAKIICLNRAEDGGAGQQLKAMADRGLTSRYTKKTEFIHMEASKPRLGLSDTVYKHLLSEADHIIHSAWPVNFNHSIETFEPHLRGVRSLCDFAAESTKRVSILFMSSVSAVACWNPEQGPVPEARIDDMSLPTSGYGRSKLLASLILEDASIAGDFPAASIVFGQIAGPESDAGSACWNKTEWLPSIIASSLHISSLPEELGQADLIDWIPIERAASLVLEIAGLEGVNAPMEKMTGYYSGVNPATCTWGDLVPSVQQFYGERIKELVSFEEWIDRLERSEELDGTVSDMARTYNPGLKLIDSYRSMLRGREARPVIFDVSRAKGRSQTMRDMEVITPVLMKHWCRQWAF
ncbi:hypothetical protein F5B22DRAFT_638347 [Xylaria bambusicola]|uniref:uncharacterized protein n=1 Tax=Xylaria bambusicola TaxID=326684 RepID=UPI0020079545|nr:uncharacterized protein F5B22DRAFT_638347 [Xylaria bambusicola]KAI0508961.1 hypothetical protein F5B22DRAFT_638347 [Xylaria bambusicola]